MANGSNVALARIAEIAYLGVPNGLPAGFIPVTQGALGLSLGSEEGFASGVYVNRNGAALVLVGTLNGATTLVLAFRGSDDRQDSINDLQGINNEYQLFGNLISGVDALAARQNITQVAVTGHSLGGAMAQLYMASHADTGSVHYVADTFGSPGALLADASDPRVTNYRIADDPAIYLGEHRAEIGSLLQSNPVLAAAAVFRAPQVFPGLQSQDVVNAIPTLNQDYVNRGTDVELPGANGSTTPISTLDEAAQARPAEHDVQNYVARLATATGSTGDDQAPASITPTTVGVQVFRFFDTHNGTHFYTASRAEQDALLASRPDLTSEGFGLNALNPSTRDPAAAPVFRFFEKTDGSHFYTISQTERDGLIASRPDLVFEGVAFSEHTTQQAGDSPVYRFFDNQDGTHFYTASATERASVLATRPDLVNEGVAFYTLSA
jgi:hypothetical protein